LRDRPSSKMSYSKTVRIAWKRAKCLLTPCFAQALDPVWGRNSQIRCIGTVEDIAKNKHENKSDRSISIVSHY
jgi:hypothetical protein